jgi:hypothetical protein
MTPVEPETNLIQLAASGDHPVVDMSVYCTSVIYGSCVMVTPQATAATIRERRDSLLTSMSAAISHALNDTKGEIISISFKHSVKYGRAKDARAVRDVVAYPRHKHGTGKPYVLLCEPGWLPDDGEVIH